MMGERESSFMEEEDGKTIRPPMIKQAMPAINRAIKLCQSNAVKNLTNEIDDKPREHKIRTFPPDSHNDQNIADNTQNHS